MSKLSKWLDENVTHSTERKENIAAAREQMAFYTEQKNKLTQQENETNAQKAIEQQKINAKQARQLRNKHRSPGFMEPANNGITETLG